MMAERGADANNDSANISQCLRVSKREAIRKQKHTWVRFVFFVSVCVCTKENVVFVGD